LNKLTQHFREFWPAWTIVFFFAAIPFRRFIELPIAVFFFAFFVLVRDPGHRQRMRELAPFLVPLFLCLWLPILLSAFDSYRPIKTWSVALFYPRFLLAALSIGALLHDPRQRKLALVGVAAVLLFWALDGYIQLLFGRDLFGYELAPDRLGALFGDGLSGYGPMLAMFSPIVLEFVRRRWPPWVFVACLLFLFGAVMIAGMRAGWLAMGLVVLFYLVRLFRTGDANSRRASLLIPFLALVVVGTSYLASDVVRLRVHDSLSPFQDSGASLAAASTWRISIWRAAIDMYQAHPVNGVGARAYSVAYYQFAPEDDVHIALNPAGNGGSFAHNMVLEAMSDTGTIGLLGLLLAYALAWRAWRNSTAQSREEALAWALPLALFVFPLNSHFSMYGVTVSSILWMLLALWAASWQRQPETVQS
jgi:O-antigen ligase